MTSTKASIWLQIVFGLVLIPCAVGAQSISSTITVIQQGLHEQYRQILERIPDGSVEVLTSPHPDAVWLEQMFLQALTRDGRSIVTTGGATTVRLIFADVSTRYEVLEQSDSIRRIVTVDVGATVTQNGMASVLPLTPWVDSVIVLRQDALAAQDAQHTSTHAELPLPERTVWDDVLEPAIFVVAAVATVVLLFTVRSQ